jgi:hypothetical protein
MMDRVFLKIDFHLEEVGRNAAPKLSQKFRAINSSPSPPWNGGEGRGEEARFLNSPLLGLRPVRSSRGEEEADQPFETVSAAVSPVIAA